ncbi:endonuclease/exonuclease/phosphatase family protein [Photobacterium toruni]|nr:endonuclease/exonuclease/phosphatase family protein [Photobacterium toruni]
MTRLTMPSSSTILLLLFTLLVAKNSYAQPFTLMSWNMQWLSTKPTSPIIRSAADYQALQQLFITYSPDILAFQEVDSTDALYQIIDHHQYQIYVSDRIHSPQDRFKINNQYTGFAVKRHIVVDDIADLSQLSSPAVTSDNIRPFKNKLRYGSVIKIIINKQPIIILNLHLKSGCFTNKQLSKQRSKSCKTLAQQLFLIKQWVKKSQQHKSQSLIIVGDINHQIIDNQQFIDKITDNSTKIHRLSAAINANCTVKLATPKYRYRTYHKLIDHLFATTNITAISQHQIQYNKQQLSQHTLSDHCPLLFTLSINLIDNT